MRCYVQDLLGRIIRVGLHCKSQRGIFRYVQVHLTEIFRISQVFIIALLLAIVVFKWFDIPVYTAKDNLYGIVVLLLLFGFATIPMVHLFEKLFTDASLANMYILCMNIIIALMTVTVIILFDVLGESDVSRNRLQLIESYQF